MYQSAQLRNRVPRGTARTVCASPTSGIPSLGAVTRARRDTSARKSRPYFFTVDFLGDTPPLPFAPGRTSRAANSAFESRPFSRLGDVPSGREASYRGRDRCRGYSKFRTSSDGGKIDFGMRAIRKSPLRLFVAINKSSLKMYSRRQNTLTYEMVAFGMTRYY